MTSSRSGRAGCCGWCSVRSRSGVTETLRDRGRLHGVRSRMPVWMGWAMWLRRLLRRYGVELHPVEQGVAGDRAGVGGPLAQGLHVFLAAAAEIGWRNGGKGHQSQGVDLDIPRADGIAAADPDLGALPQPEGDGDVARDHVVAQLRAEVHQPMLTGPVARDWAGGCHRTPAGSRHTDGSGYAEGYLHGPCTGR